MDASLFQPGGRADTLMEPDMKEESGELDTIVASRGDEKSGEAGSNISISTSTVAFNLETIRLVAYLNLIIVLVVGATLTIVFVDVPPEETTIYKLFGFNHSCNFLDHHPAREVAAILIVAFIIPMVVYLVGAYFRSRNAHLRGEVPRWFWLCTKIVTPFNVLAVSLFYMVFVNPPDQDYGFLAHYIPYFCLKLALGFLAIQQSLGLVFRQRWLETKMGESTLESQNVIPFGLRPVWAKIYSWQMAVATVVYATMVFTVASGNPMLDTVNDPTHRLIGMTIMYYYSAVALFLPIAFAAWERKHTPDSVITVA